MKANRHHFFLTWSSGLLMITSIFFVSCSLDNFPQPLPVDIKNSNRFPEALRGRWLSVEDSNYVIIDKHLLRIVGDARPTKVVRGVWPKLTASGNSYDLKSNYDSEKYQHFDSLLHPIDTVMNYVITDMAIYQVQGKGMMSNGYSYRKQNDTLEFEKRDTVWMDLGANMCIRDLGKGLYVLNINNILLAQESTWWEIILLEVDKGDTIKCWGVSDKMKTSHEFIYYFEEKYFSASYYESFWTAAEILQLKEHGYFELKGIFFRKQ